MINRVIILALVAFTLLISTRSAVSIHGEGDRPTADESVRSPRVGGTRGQWVSYGQRYAIVIMGGDEPSSGQMYRWYWDDTSSKVWTLMDWGFSPNDIIFLSYGDSATAHPELVDGVSTEANVEAAFSTIASAATNYDLVHVWWVDHGSTSGFNVHGGFVDFTDLKVWIDNINCRAYIGAYNQCYSGAVMPHMSGLCTAGRRVISTTSVDASQSNSYGWAGMWRQAVRGGRPTSTVAAYSDANEDGYITMDEAYEWETPHSNEAGEYPLFDDNCDGSGGDLTDPATYDAGGSDPVKDGYYGQFYSLMGWYDHSSESPDPDPDNPKSPPSVEHPDSAKYDVDIVWSVGAPLPTPVSRGASGVIGDKIYLFGGHPTPAPVHYVYDISSDTWSADISALPIHGSLNRGVTSGEKLYVFGGHTLGSDTMRCYDPVGDSWDLLSAPYTGWRECCKYGAACVAQKIYYYYMEDRYSYYPRQCFWEYDINTDTWIEKVSPPTPKRMYVASASDGLSCYSLGGLNHEDLTPMADAVRYNPIAGNWQAIDPLPEPVAFADGDFLNGVLYIAGGGAGYDPWPASDRVYCWMQGAGWMSATSLPEPVGCPHVELATVDGSDCIFVFGGYRDGYLNTLYIGEIHFDISCIPGDADCSGTVDIDDAVYLINYVFSSGPQPIPMLCCGDANGDGSPETCGVDIDDIVYLIAFIFSEGPVPLSACDLCTY